MPKDLCVFYVYVLFDWLGTPRYVGKGKDGRIFIHERKTDPVNWMKNEFIEQTWIMLGEIPKVIIQQDILERDAFALETILIKIIGRLDQNRGPLVNMTDGGDGNSGHTLTNHARLRISLSLTFDQRSKRSKLAAQSRTPEDRSTSSKKGHNNTAPEARRERSLKAAKSQTPEQRINKAIRGADARSPEYRKDIARRGVLSQTIEQLKDKSQRGIESQTPEQLHNRAVLGHETRLRNQTTMFGMRWINNGQISKLIKSSENLPNGWFYGRKTPIKKPSSKLPVQEPPTDTH